MKPHETKPAERLLHILHEYDTGDTQRGNSATAYAHATAAVFRSVASGGKRPPPMCVQIEITNTCSTGCRMCDRYTWKRHSRYRHDRELTTHQQKSLLSDLAAFGVETTIWTGGEPMTHPDLCDLLEHAAGCGLAIGVLTNGVGITPQIATALVTHAKWIRISMDNVPGSTSAVRTILKQYASTDAESISEAVRNSVSNLQSAQDEHPESGFHYGYAFTIQKSNVRSVPAMVEHAEQSGIPVSFKIAHGCGGYLCDESDLTWLLTTVLSSSRYVDSPASNLRYLRDYLFRHLSFDDILQGTPTNKLYRDTDTTCFTGNLFSLIDAFGDVHLCCHLYDDNGRAESDQRDKYRIGSAVDQSFQDVWNSKEYDSIRSRLHRVNVDDTACKNCTRHWLPNITLSRLYNEVFLPDADANGIESAVSSYESLLSEYPTDPVWF